MDAAFRLLLAGQVEAMKSFATIDGVWRGAATATQPDGSRHAFVQTERLGPFLGGSVKMIEGRGYDDCCATPLSSRTARCMKSATASLPDKSRRESSRCG